VFAGQVRRTGLFKVLRARTPSSVCALTKIGPAEAPYTPRN
jgi:hypothetical protein